MNVPLNEIEAMVDALPPADQVRLLRILVPKLAEAVLAAEANGNGHGTNGTGAWHEFRRVGERLAATPSPDGVSVTQTLFDTRR